MRSLQQSVTIQIDSMSLHYDITKDVRFQQGIEKGELQGIEKGIDLGIEKGATLKAHAMVMKLLRQNAMGADEIADFVEVPLAFVLECQKEL